MVKSLGLVVSNAGLTSTALKASNCTTSTSHGGFLGALGGFSKEGCNVWCDRTAMACNILHLEKKKHGMIYQSVYCLDVLGKVKSN